MAKTPPILISCISINIGVGSVSCVFRIKVIDAPSIAPDTIPVTNPQVAAVLCANSGLPIIATPSIAKNKLMICTIDWRSLKYKKPMAAKKKICKLLSRVEIPGPTA